MPDTEQKSTPDEFPQLFCQAYLDGNEDERALLAVLYKLSIDHIGHHPRNAGALFHRIRLSGLQDDTRQALLVLKRKVLLEAKLWGKYEFWVDGVIAKRLRNEVIKACTAVALTITIHQKREAVQQGWNKCVAGSRASTLESLQRHMIDDTRDTLKDAVRAMCAQMGADPEPLLARVDKDFDTLYREVRCSIDIATTNAYKWVSEMAAGVKPLPKKRKDKIAA